MRQLLLGVAHGLPLTLVDRIVERAEGVPLYAVETLRMLVDSGRLVERDGTYELTGELDELDVPDSLHALIASRLDALDPIDRSLLQDASVLGKTFRKEGVSALGTEIEDLDRRLAGLVKRELLAVESDPRSPERGQYGFVQSLIREVAYQTLAKRDRYDRHLAAARFFETLDDDELSSALATHYLEAFRAAPGPAEADAVRASARAALIDAAERAASLGAHEQAFAYFEQALDITEDEGERAELWSLAATEASRGALPDVGERYLSQLIEWHLANSDPVAAGRARAQLGRAYVTRSRLDLAVATLEEAYHDLEHLPPEPLIVDVMGQIARAHSLSSHPEKAQEWLERAIPLAEQLDLVPLIVDLLITRATMLNTQSRFQEPLVLLTGALRLAEKHDLVTQQGRAINNLCFVNILLDPVETLATARLGLDLARRVGDKEQELYHVFNAADVAVWVGEWQWATELLDENEHDGLPDFFQATLACARVMIGGITGDFDRARASSEIARQFVLTSTAPQNDASLMESEALFALAEGRFEEAHDIGLREIVGYNLVFRGHIFAGRAALAMRDPERAKQVADRLDEVPLRVGWVGLNKRSLRAGIDALEGHIDKAAEMYAEIAQAWRALGCPFDLGMTQLEAVELLGVDHPDARKAADEAREVFTLLGAHPFLERLERALAP
jgi:tetratricopeptide (TPR) repeat protein